MALEAEKHELAVTMTLRLYGAEVYGFLLASSRERPDAEDAFSGFYEAVWTGLGRFSWRSTLRTWCYRIAVNRLARVRRDRARRRRREIPLSRAPGCENLMQRVRSETADYRKTHNRAAVERARESLSSEERYLLILRVDRRLTWHDIALTHLAEDNPSPEAIQRTSAMLRKRFERLKAKLRRALHP